MHRSSTMPGSQLATSAEVEITRKNISPTYFLGEIDFRLLQSWPLAWFLYTESYANQRHGITFTCPMFPDVPSGQQQKHLSGKPLNIEQRTRLADGYLAYLSHKKPEYFVTLTYRQPQSDRAAEMGMRGFVLKLLNRLPKRVRQNFGGLVCAERHTDARFEGTYHFHFLLWGMDGVMTEPFAWLQEQAIKAASELHPRPPGPNCDCAEAERKERPKTCRGGLSCRGPKLSGPRWVDVQRIECTPGNAHEYTIADIRRVDRPVGGQLLDIGPSGVTGTLLLND